MTRLLEFAMYLVIGTMIGMLVYKGVEYDTRYGGPNRRFEERRRKGWV